MTASRLDEALARAATELDAVAAVLLFGSHATGRARADSDIDVALLLEQLPPPDQRLSFLKQTIARLGRHVAADRLHVLILNDAPPHLAFEALRTGRVIARADAVALHRFRVRTYRMHADYEHVERLFRARTERRARHG